MKREREGTREVEIKGGGGGTGLATNKQSNGSFYNIPSTHELEGGGIEDLFLRFFQQGVNEGKEGEIIKGGWAMPRTRKRNVTVLVRLYRNHNN